ncbi:MAG: hypothetical protein AMXMBFR58_28240 [Phycisphaerae bacterium]
MNRNSLVVLTGGVVVGVLAASLMPIARSGPLDPPSGPVAPTSPSLADIASKVDAVSAVVGASGAFPPGLQVEAVPTFSNSIVDALTGVTGKVRLYSITCGQGQYTLTEKNSGRNIAFMTGAVLRTSDNEAFNSNQSLMGGLEVQPPLRLNSQGTNVGTIAHIYYWPSNP